ATALAGAPMAPLSHSGTGHSAGPGGNGNTNNWGGGNSGGSAAGGNGAGSSPGGGSAPGTNPGGGNTGTGGNAGNNTGNPSSGAVGGGGSIGGDDTGSGDSAESDNGQTVVADVQENADDAGNALVEHGKEFIIGLGEGAKNQATGLLEMVLNPFDTAKALIELGKALANDPAGTIAAIKEELAKELEAVASGDGRAAGRIVGENLSPAVALKVLSRLSKFGDVAQAGGKKPGKGDSDNDKKDEGCSSFLAGTLVWTPGGMSPIEDLKKGDTVFTRSDTEFTDHSNQITQLLRREAEGYYE